MSKEVNQICRGRVIFYIDVHYLRQYPAYIISSDTHSSCGDTRGPSVGPRVGHSPSVQCSGYRLVVVVVESGQGPLHE